MKVLVRMKVRMKENPPEAWEVQNWIRDVFYELHGRMGTHEWEDIKKMWYKVYGRDNINKVFNALKKEGYIAPIKRNKKVIAWRWVGYIPPDDFSDNIVVANPKQKEWYEDTDKIADIVVSEYRKRYPGDSHKIIHVGNSKQVGPVVIGASEAFGFVRPWTEDGKRQRKSVVVVKAFYEDGSCIYLETHDEFRRLETLVNYVVGTLHRDYEHTKELLNDIEQYGLQKQGWAKDFMGKIKCLHGNLDIRGEFIAPSKR